MINIVRHAMLEQASDRRVLAPVGCKARRVHARVPLESPSRKLVAEEHDDTHRAVGLPRTKLEHSEALAYGA